MVKYAVLAGVPMLQFALTFAAGFASTLVMHRMAGDNEILAMSVSGVSYRRILTPVFVLGLLLTVIMFLLVNFTVPHFWNLMKEMIARDVTGSSPPPLRKGLSVGRTQLFADDVLITEDEPETGQRTSILLGVAALNRRSGCPIRIHRPLRHRRHPPSTPGRPAEAGPRRCDDLPARRRLADLRAEGGTRGPEPVEGLLLGPEDPELARAPRTEEAIRDLSDHRHASRFAR